MESPAVRFGSGPWTRIQKLTVVRLPMARSRGAGLVASAVAMIGAVAEAQGILERTAEANLTDLRTTTLLGGWW